jgi:hypothetical protein
MGCRESDVVQKFTDITIKIRFYAFFLFWQSKTGGHDRKYEPAILGEVFPEF